MRETVLNVAEYLGTDPSNVMIVLIMMFMSSMFGLLIWIRFNHDKKEFAEVDAETNKKGEIKKYTRGNYAKDIKAFVKLYKTVKTIPEQKELLAICERIMNNVDKIEMMGRSSYNGRLWAGIHDTYKACEATSNYITRGPKSLDILRASVYFGISYYGDKKNDDVIGVTRTVRNANQIKFHQEVTMKRMPKQMKKRIAQKGDHRTNYLIGLNRWEPIESAQAYAKGL